MTTKNLKEFVALVDCAKFTEAAEKLFLSQSTLSRHIKAMEKELGFSLLRRSTKAVELTPSGRRYYLYAVRILEIQNEFISSLYERYRELGGSITVGYNENMPLFHVTDLISHFIKDYPNIRVQVYQDSGRKLRDAVRNSHCDLAFVQDIFFGENVTKGEFVTYHLSMDPLVAILPLSHRLAHQERIALGDLAKEHFAFLQSQMPVMCPYCRNAGFEPQIVYPGCTPRVIYDLVGNDLCVTLNWKRIAEFNVTERCVIKDIFPPVFTNINLVHKRAPHYPLPMALFLDYVLKHMHLLQEPGTQIGFSE